MWRGHPYADIEAHGHLDGEITRLTEMRLAALEARIDADMRAGRHREVVAELDALTVEHPYRENLRALHMLALYRSGRQAEALRAYGRTRELLVEGLGIDPSPELKDLERRILAQDRDLLVSRRPDRAAPGGARRRPRRRRLATTRPSARSRSAGASRSWRRPPTASGGVKLAPKGTAGYVVFAEPINAVRAARAIVNERHPRRHRLSATSRCATTSRSGRRWLVRPVSSPSPIPARSLLSSAAHDALTAAPRPAGRPSRSGASTSSGSTRASTSTNSSGTGSARTSRRCASTGCRRRSPVRAGALGARLRAAGS